MKCLFVGILVLTGLSCVQEKTFKGHAIYKSIANDSALYYYELGWKQIMDDGYYGPAEISYRKVLEHDPDFLIGKAVLGRLTLDLQERLQLEKEIDRGKNLIEGDERLILDVYQGLVKFTSARQQESPDTKKLLQRAFRTAEKNLGKITHKYPNEIYMKSEYIEFLHSRYGPRNALDSLDVLTTADQKDNPFLLGYSAIMQAEMDNFKTAVEQANRLKDSTEDSMIPKPYAVLANVYFQMDSLELAKINVDKANQMDPRNLDASRLKEKIDDRLGL